MIWSYCINTHVVHGSYNWTKKAQYNKETISIDTDRTTAEKFADEFIKLKVSCCKDKLQLI